MARTALGLGVRDLAKSAGVSPDTIARLERGEPLRGATLEAVQHALESAGVIFVAENGDGPGVRLKKRPPRQPPSTDPEELEREQDAADRANNAPWFDA